MSLEHQVGLRVDQLAEGTDFSVMHGYSIYADWAKEPLDSDVVPFAQLSVSGGIVDAQAALAEAARRRERRLASARPVA